jgi:hypothetical protein
MQRMQQRVGGIAWLLATVIAAGLSACGGNGNGEGGQGTLLVSDNPSATAAPPLLTLTPASPEHPTCTVPTATHTPTPTASAAPPAADCTATPVAGWGDEIDAHHIGGPVGLAPPPIDPAAAASMDDVAAFCRAHRDYDTPPPLLALPPPSELPAWCSEEEAYRQLVAACGVPRVAAVAAGADPAVADGSIDRPFASIRDAIEECGGESCHILIGSGTYAESPRIGDCTFVEGGIQIDGGTATRGAPRPQVHGVVHAAGSAIVLARLDVQHEYGALGTNGDVLVSDTVLRGGYKGGCSAWQATGPRLCRMSIAGGYSGFEIAWHSSRLWLAGSAVSACYEGMHLSWGSRDLKVLDSVVYGGYAAVSTSWGSTGVEVRGNRLGSEYAAVDIHIAPDDDDVFPATFDVTIAGNRIVSGSLPESDSARNIVVEGNTRE